MKKRVLIVGGGYAGLYVALGLEKHARHLFDVTLVSPDSYTTYQPFLPEAASGNIEPRHVVVPLRRTLRRTNIVTGRLTRLDHDGRRALVDLGEDEVTLQYDIVVIAVGSVARVLPIPGLAEQAIGFRTVAEAIWLRNHVLDRMDLAEATDDPLVRERALTFCFVGAGYAGAEAIAELEDMARDAARMYRNITRDQMRWVLVEAGPQVMHEIGPKLGDVARRVMESRGIDVKLKTTLDSAAAGVVELSDGTRFATDTLVWTAGVKAHPVVRETGLPLDERGRVKVDATLRVEGTTDAWALGDCAAIPDITTGGYAPPTAQHALRQAWLLAKNLRAATEAQPLKNFRYTNKGSVAALGRYKGVANPLGISLRGFPAWFMHRSYHVLWIPTWNRKVRVLVDWTVALFFKRDVVQLGSLATPRRAFEEAARGSENTGS